VVKLLVSEEGSDLASILAAEASEIVSASILYVEARAALARAVRDGRLRGGQRVAARSELEHVWEEVIAIELGLELIRRSGEAAELTGLRANDAIHFAAALSLDEPELLLATWDQDLARAAREAGVVVAP
jgi:uncharacterized protein